MKLKDFECINCFLSHTRILSGSTTRVLTYEDTRELELVADGDAAQWPRLPVWLEQTKIPLNFETKKQQRCKKSFTINSLHLYYFC